MHQNVQFVLKMFYFDSETYAIHFELDCDHHQVIRGGYDYDASQRVSRCLSVITDDAS